MITRYSHRGALLWVVVLLVLGGVAAGIAGVVAHDGRRTPRAAASGPPGPGERPDVVFVLTDDLSTDLVRFMPHVQELEREGTTFANYTVTDSLCCPSRSSIFTGRFPHDTGVFTNGGRDGGFAVFHQRGEESSTWATDLQHAGYRTALLGKYLNGYLPQSRYVPPGWTQWDVAGSGYREYNYRLDENGRPQHFGRAPADYLTDVVSAKAQRFVERSASAHRPFALEVATFAPHAPSTPAPRDAASFPDLAAPRSAAWNTLPTDPPSWLAGRGPLSARGIAAIDAEYRRRAQSVQAVDRMIGNLEQTLEQTGVAGNTLFVFSSDNGYHMGQHRLMPGKMTAFDTDIHVPLVIAGPGVAHATVTRPVENVDLRPTFDALARTPSPSDVDGRSLVPLLAGPAPRTWRTTALVEHHGPDHNPTDPDLPARDSGNPTTYTAIRTATWTYVEYRDGEREYYDRSTDPDELHNTVGTLSTLRLAQLHARVVALTNCHGETACWTAAGG